MTTKKTAPKKAAPKKNKIVEDKITPKRATSKGDLTAESLYEQYRGAEISTDRQQPEKSTSIYVDVLNENNEIETHMVDMRQCPQDIIDSWIGELV